MSSPMVAQKQELRRQMRARLRELPPEQLARKSLEACELLRQQTLWRQAKVVMFYWAMAGEVDLKSLLEEALAIGKTVALPRFLPELASYEAFEIRNIAADTVAGKFGITEPRAGCPSVALNRLDLILAPGVAFDAAGHRLGRGQGYYDRLLAHATPAKCGIAFDEQIAEQIPAEPHDVKMNYILTPTRWQLVLHPT